MRDRACLLLALVLSLVGCGHPLRQGGSAKDGGSRDAATDSMAGGGGPETADVATISDGPAGEADALPDTKADAFAADAPCALLCPASNSDVGFSGYVDLSGGDSASVDVDALQVTVCRDSNCAVLPREPYYDSQATGWNCADAGSSCAAKVFGGNALAGGTLYAYVTLTSGGGTFYAVGGSVMFPFSSSVADVASTTRITIQSGDVTYLDASSNDCTVNLGCCGNLYYQSCNLSWN
jgi:hypothetical protein